MAYLNCPECDHHWEDDDLFEEVDVEDQKLDLEMKIEAQVALMADMREILKGVVDAWDNQRVEPRLITISYGKETVQRMRRLIEASE